MSSSEWRPSDMFSTQSNASSSTPASAHAARAPVKSALPQLGLALRILASIDRVGLQHLDDLEARAERVGELGRAYEVEVVGGGVVFRIASMRRAGEALHWQVEPPRAVLPLVVPVRREVDELVVTSAGPEHMRHHPVDLGVAPSAPLVGRPPGVRQACEHQAVLDPADAILVRASQAIEPIVPGMNRNR